MKETIMITVATIIVVLKGNLRARNRNRNCSALQMVKCVRESPSVYEGEEGPMMGEGSPCRMSILGNIYIACYSIIPMSSLDNKNVNVTCHYTFKAHVAGANT